MPSGNFPRQPATNFISTVISSTDNNNAAPASNSESRGTVRTTRRTIGNGSWIVNEIQSSQRRLQQQPQSQSQQQQSTPAESSLNAYFFHPRQSTFADMESYANMNNTESEGVLLSDVLSPSSIQSSLSSASTRRASTDLIDQYMSSELDVAMGESPFDSSNTLRFEVSQINQGNNVPMQLQRVIRNAAAIHNSVGMQVQNSMNVGGGGGSPNNMIGVRTSVNPPNNSALRNKIVYNLMCTYCCIPVCERAMRAILLADTKIELYSTDIPPRAVRTMDEDRMTSGCNCRIRDTVCSGCGNVLGYHVSQPCDRCLDARNNGHFWMFCSEGVVPTERKHADGNGPLYWASLTPMCEFVPASMCSRPEQAGNSAYESFCR